MATCKKLVAAESAANLTHILLTDQHFSLHYLCATGSADMKLAIHSPAMRVDAERLQRCQCLIQNTCMEMADIC